jgi:succinate dehydrogenase / fumarate reductase cytochrome b subunit
VGQKNHRPVYLNLLKIRLPVGGAVSILHRLTGFALVLALPFGLYALQYSLQGAEEFARLSGWFSTIPGRAAGLLVLWAVAQHFFSGLRHLLFDVDIGVGRTAARSSAWLTFAAALVTVAVAGAAW